MRETIFNQLTRAIVQPPQAMQGEYQYKTIEMRRDETPYDSHGAGHHEICYMTARRVEGKSGWLVETHSEAAHFARPVMSEVVVRQRTGQREVGQVDTILGLARAFRKFQAGLKEEGFRPAPKLQIDEIVIPPNEAQVFRPNFGTAA